MRAGKDRGSSKFRITFLNSCLPQSPKYQLKEEYNKSLFCFQKGKKDERKERGTRDDRLEVDEGERESGGEEELRPPRRHLAEHKRSLSSGCHKRRREENERRRRVTGCPLCQGRVTEGVKEAREDSEALRLTLRDGKTVAPAIGQCY